MAYKIEIKGNSWVATDTDTNLEVARVSADDLEFRTRTGNFFYFHEKGNAQRLIRDRGIAFGDIIDPTDAPFASFDAVETWLQDNTGAGAGGGTTTPAGVATNASITTQTTALSAKTDEVKASTDAVKTSTDLVKTAVDTNKAAVDLAKTAVDENKAEVILAKTAVDQNKAEVILVKDEVAKVVEKLNPLIPNGTTRINESSDGNTFQYFNGATLTRTVNIVTNVGGDIDYTIT